MRTQYYNYMDFIEKINGRLPSPSTFSDFITPSYIKTLERLLDNRKPLRNIYYFEYGIRDDRGVIKKWSYNFSELLINYQTIGNKISTILNELNFISGKFDGLCIFFAPEIEQDKIVIKKQDNYSINIEYGLLPEKVNHMNYIDIKNLIKTITFKVLKTVYSNDNNKLEKITVAENDRRLEFTEGDKLVLLRQEENNIILKVSYDNSNHNTFLYYNDRLNKHEIERIYLDVFSLYELNLIEKIVIERDFIIFEPKDKSYYDQNAMINRFSIKYRLNNINFF